MIFNRSLTDSWTFGQMSLELKKEVIKVSVKINTMPWAYCFLRQYSTKNVVRIRSDTRVDWKAIGEVTCCGWRFQLQLRCEKQLTTVLLRFSAVAQVISGDGHLWQVKNSPLCQPQRFSKLSSLGGCPSCFTIFCTSSQSSTKTFEDICFLCRI